MNPFTGKNIAESNEMKTLFNKMREVTAAICLQYAEEQGEALVMDTVHRNIHALVDFDIIMFKIQANSFLTNQPETTLPMSERIAIAAHEAYKEVSNFG